MTALITLTSDFGLTDGYVAAMKGVILSINPNARLVDISHTIEPQNISQAAFILSTTCHAFPDETIHLVVVDPGVGTDRRGLAVKTPHASFVAPDNGVLTYVLQENSGPSGGTDESEIEAVSLTNSEYWHAPVSPTFHGRDIFAPVAAHISLGVPLEELGEKVTALSLLSAAGLRHNPDGSLTGAVIHTDHFGNLITNISTDDLSGAPGTLVIEIAGEHIRGLSRTYAEENGLVALVGSSSHLEIALKEGNASRFLSAGVGEEVRVRQG